MLAALSLYFRIFRLGLHNIGTRKLRSALTVLGIVFGVCSVISMLAIGEGASREAQDQIKRLGSQNIIVRNIKPSAEAAASGGGGGGGSRSGRRPNTLDYGLRYADAEILAETLPSVDVIVPVKARTDRVRFKTRELQATVIGTVPWQTRAQSLTVASGRFITQLDMERSANVCAIGQRVARAIFLYEDPIGQPLTIGRNTYQVVGVLGSSGGEGGGSKGLPTETADVFVPLTTMREYDGDLFIQSGAGSFQSEFVELNEIILSVKERDQVASTAQLVEDTLRRRHKVVDYELIVPLRLIEEARRTAAAWSLVLGSIASISLLVGGIGIMNIMLASVSERTREIGVRRALGARERDILMQFLVECVLLSLGGGLLGMALGAAIPWAVTYFTGRPTDLTAQAFILAFGVSVLTGVVFGLYPARSAAKLDPIEALRYE